MNKHLNIFSFFFIFFICSVNSQNINYSYFNSSSDNLKSFLFSNNNFFSGGSNELPYFQSKNGKFVINFYNSIGANAVYKFSDKNEFNIAINSIIKSAFFEFKFCSSYEASIVFNFISDSGNEIRFNIDEKSVSVQFPSELGNFMSRNKEMLPVFICKGDYAYAYHTNLKCEGLNNCKGELGKSNIKSSKDNKYKICKICSTY